MSVALGVAPVGTEPLAGYPYRAPAGSSALAWPLILLEIAFLSDPLDGSPSWVDVGGVGGNDVHEFSCTQNGRMSPLETSSKGTLSADVDISRTRDLDPTNGSSAYAPNVREHKPARLRIVADGVTWPMWRGLVDDDGFQVDWHVESFYEAYCAVAASDVFDLLGRLPLTGMAARPKERADLRLAAILDFVGWPAALRRISVARTILSPEDVSGGTALDALLAVDLTECGRLRVDPAGVLEFLSRPDVATATRQTIPQAVFSDSGAYGTIPYTELTPRRGLVKNVIDITHPTAEPVHVEDPASRTAHGPSGFSREVRDVTEVARTATAEHFRDVYNDGQIQLSMSVDVADTPPGFPTGLFSAMAALWVGDRVTVERLFPPAGGDVFTGDWFVESKADHAVIDHEWTCDLTLSAAPPVVVGSKWGTGKWGSAKYGW